MGEKQRGTKGRKTEKSKKKKIELEKDENEFYKSEKKDKVVSKDAISDDIVGALKIAGVEGEENINARTDGRKVSVDDPEERKETKRKHKEKKKMGGVAGTSSEAENSEAEKSRELVKRYENCGDVPVENGEEERAKKNKKKKKEKERSGNEVKNNMTNEEKLLKERNHLDGKSKEDGKLAVKEKNLDKIRDNSQKGAENGDVAEVSNDKDGGQSKKKNKKKIREREDAFDEVEDEMQVDEEGDKSEMKKKRKRENDNEMKTNEEGDRIKKERKKDSVSGEVENEMKTNEEKEETKKKKERKKANSSAEVEVEMQTNEEGEKKKKKKKKERKRENASNVVKNNMKTNEEGEKSRKKKRSKKEIVSGDVEDKMKTDEEVEKSKKKTRKREYVSADVEDKPEADERGKSKKNKKRKREILFGDVEDKLDEIGKGDGGNKDKKKKGKAEKQISSGEAHDGKAITRKDTEVDDTFENQTPEEKSKRVSFSDHVEVFLDGSLSGSKSISDQGEGLVQGKRFTPKEDELLEKAVLGYIEDHNLGDDGLHMILNCKSYPETKGCWKEISTALPWRPTASVYYRGHILFERGETRKWTTEEYEYVRDFVKERGADWKMLSTELKKHRFHCKDTWRRIKHNNLRKGHWTQGEYQTLFDLVNMDLRMRALEERKSKHGMLRDNICWGSISDRLSTRANATCCIKWYRQLTSPMVQQGLWADTDDYRLVDALSSLDAPCLEDVDWDSLLEHRDGDLCRKRWNQMVKHIGEYGLKTFSEQVEVLAKRYSRDCIEVREEFDSKPILP